MERLTSVNSPRRGMAVHLAALGVLLLGPSMVARIISFTTSLVTWPITQELRIADNRFEIFNTELVLVYLVAVLGLNILSQTGLLSIGHSAFFLVGAYVVGVATVTHGWTFWLALPLAGVVGGAVALVLGVPSLRLGAFTLAMVTVGYAFVAEDLAVEWRGITGGGDGLRGVAMPRPFDELTSYYWLLVIVVVAAYFVMHNVLRSPLGRGAKAVEEAPVAAPSLGINVYAVKLTSFALSGCFAAIAGGLYAPLLGFVAPDSFTVQLAILLLLMVLFGGSGTLAGPIIGTVLLFRIPIEVERATDQPGEWSLLVYGLVLLVSVHLFPRGLMSAWWAIRRRIVSAPPPPAEARRRADIGTMIAAVPASGDPLLEAVAVGKSIGGVRPLDAVDLVVRPATVHALIGPNGAGKTTFLNAMSGYVRIDEGSIRLFGRDVSGDSTRVRARAGLARTFQTPFVFPGMSCLENVMVALDRHRASLLGGYLLRLPPARREERESYQRAVDILTAVGLDGRAADAAGDLPPGERRLLEIARAVAIDPRLVLMDEPAAGLTSSEIDELSEIIRSFRAAGVGVLLVEHHVEMVMRLADEVTVIDFGEVIAHGAPEAVRNDPVVIAAYLGEPDREPGGAGDGNESWCDESVGPS